MRTVKVSDYHKEIIEQFPALQKLTKEEAGKLITTIVKQFFKNVLKKLEADPYVLIKIYATIQKIYIKNKNARGTVKRKVYRQGIKCLYELADLDETYMDPVQHAELQELEDRYNDQRRAEEGTSNPDMEQNLPGL